MKKILLIIVKFFNTKKWAKWVAIGVAAVVMVTTVLIPILLNGNRSTDSSSKQESVVGSTDSESGGMISGNDSANNSVSWSSDHEHVFLEELEIKKATCESEGKIMCCCSCGYQESVSVPALKHEMIFEDAKWETCTENGWYAYEYWSRCAYTTYEEIPAIGHEYVDRVCIRCGDEINWR